VARSAALAAGLALALLVVAAPAAQAAWSAPFTLVAPGSLDYLPTQLAYAPSGAAAAAFTTEDVDTPGSSRPYLVIRAADGAISPTWAIPAASQILALAYDGSGLELLTGSTTNGLDCCSSSQAVRFTGSGTLQRPQTLVGGLTGATLGQLVVLGDARMLAAVATEQGVWTLQSSAGGQFTGKRRLTRSGQSPQSLSATSLGGEGSLVAWTAAGGPPGSANPRSISYAEGSKAGAPRAAHVLLTVPAGHRIDELDVARRGSSATAAWVESWYDAHGNYHSQVRASDFGSHPSARSLSAVNGQASGISFAANAAGAQAAAWETCNGSGACSVRVTTRGAKGGFGFPVALGAIDATETPSVAVGTGGQVVVGWVRNGQPVAAVGSAARGRFGAARVLSPTAYALDLTVAFGPRREALAAWTQGTLDPSVVAAGYQVP
jgi:hypothetical protein